MCGASSGSGTLASTIPLAFLWKFHVLGARSNALCCCWLILAEMKASWPHSAHQPRNPRAEWVCAAAENAKKQQDSLIRVVNLAREWAAAAVARTVSSNLSPAPGACCEIISCWPFHIPREATPHANMCRVDDFGSAKDHDYYRGKGVLGSLFSRNILIV